MMKQLIFYQKIAKLKLKNYNLTGLATDKCLYLTINLYSNSMGTGTSENSTFEDDEWSYPKPGSVNEFVLKTVCRLK